MKISKYRAAPNEANFGRPIRSQIAHGTHITFEMITKRDGTFYAARWPSGLPGHDDPPNTLRFPHGLICRGESLDDCARRLVQGQLGMGVRAVRLAYWDSYLDDYDHWHVEPGCVVEVTGRPRKPKQASEIVTFDTEHFPAMTFWSKGDFLELVAEHMPELL